MIKQRTRKGYSYSVMVDELTMFHSRSRQKAIEKAQEWCLQHRDDYSTAAVYRMSRGMSSVIMRYWWDKSLRSLQYLEY